MWSRSASTASSATIPASSEARLAAVKRRALAGIFALALAVAGLLAATVTAGLRPLSALATTTSTTPATTAAEPLIATGVSVGGVPVGGMTTHDAYRAVRPAFSPPPLIGLPPPRLA